MTIKTRWWWIRHAPVINPEGKLYGQLDMNVDLSDSEKFETLARVLPEKAEWITTSLTRAKETGRVLSEIIMSEAAVVECDNFLEQSFGDWEGSSWDDITPSASKAFWKDPANNRIPNGESFALATIFVAGTSPFICLPSICISYLSKISIQPSGVQGTIKLFNLFSF